MVRIPTSKTPPASPAQPSPAGGSRELFSRSDFELPLVLPFTILVDHRERSAGWRFTELRGDASDDRRPLVVPQREVHLLTGDYMVQAGEAGQRLIIVERKSHEDIIGSVGGGHVNFRKEHERMKSVVDAGGACFVVIESGYDRVMSDLELADAGLNPAAMAAVVASWPHQFGVPWHWAGSRRRAEELCLRLFRTWTKKFAEKTKAKK